VKLALFDLDHTLIPFDSGMAWMRFLAQRGILPPDAPDTYLASCHQFVAGTLDIHGMHRATVAPMSPYTREQIAQWGGEFEAEIAAQVPASMQALVRQHLDAGDLCAIVTATTRFVAEPFGRVFGVAHVVATEAAMKDGWLTGEIAGEPCYREHKLTRVEGWLAGPSLLLTQGLAAFNESWFYSDSASDLPLLSAVTHPVAVRPDQKLRAHAVRSAWPILE
jgi:HAD superfamily hydrolase (TIGR01490 family)